MHYTVIQQFEGKVVEVHTSAGRQFAGILKYDIHNGVVIVQPVNQYLAQNLGPAFIDVYAIISIQEILSPEIKCYSDDPGCEKVGS
jgi:hypothetical protein